MSDGSSIEWCDATWTIAVGCTRVDHRCDNCYAIPFVHRNLHASHEGLTKLRPKSSRRPGVDWNGTVRVLPERLSDPLRWKKPRRIFVGSMTDLFHPAISFEYIAAVFGVMAACPRHTFLVLTKRPERAREFFAWIVGEGSQGYVWQTMHVHAVRAGMDPEEIDHRMRCSWPWPLPNVHLGVSVSDQATADEAISELLAIPAASRWVSYEPALGPVDFFAFLDTPLRNESLAALRSRPMPGLDTIVIGGESGPGARPFQLQWARDVLRQVRSTATRVFVKQLGANAEDAVNGIAGAATKVPHEIKISQRLVDRKGGDMAEWPADLRVREWAT